MKVYFSHGKESGPWGSKIQRLAAIAEGLKYKIESIDYSDIPDPDVRVERLLARLENEQDNFLLVGSSMGGYVSLVAAEQVNAKGVFLLAPALYVNGYIKQSYGADVNNIEIVHGWSDDIIPCEHSIKYAKLAECSLHLINGDHRLISSIDAVARIFEGFLLTVRE